ncbi:MAG: hypothetical protein OD811_04085, partial [Alphaproteobacteria bacterium]
KDLKAIVLRGASGRLYGTEKAYAYNLSRRGVSYREFAENLTKHNELIIRTTDGCGETITNTFIIKGNWEK